jgi:hypothetical protein
MVPPFLAHYGVITRNLTLLTLLTDAYNQIQLYHPYLRDPSANYLWKHIVLGTNGTDPGHWSTGNLRLDVPAQQACIQSYLGNGWAAAGMLRVLGTIQNSEFADTLQIEQNNLTSWVKEIHAGMYHFLVSYHTPSLNMNMLFYAPVPFRTQIRASSQTMSHNQLLHPPTFSMPHPLRFSLALYTVFHFFGANIRTSLSPRSRGRHCQPPTQTTRHGWYTSHPKAG